MTSKIQRLEQEVLSLQKQNAELEERMEKLEKDNKEYEEIIPLLKTLNKLAPFSFDADLTEEEKEERDKKRAQRAQERKERIAKRRTRLRERREDRTKRTDLKLNSEDLPKDWAAQLAERSKDAPKETHEISLADQAFLHNNGAELSSQTRVVPHRGNEGFIDGYRLSGIRRNSIFSRLMFKNGDVVMAYNNTPLTSLKEIMVLYENWDKNEKIEFLLMRRNQLQILKFTLEQEK